MRHQKRIEGYKISYMPKTTFGILNQSNIFYLKKFKPSPADHKKIKFEPLPLLKNK
jgi:hypothetical protein